MTRNPQAGPLGEEVREELVRGILRVLQRSYTTTGPSGPTYALAEFFRGLDEATLRGIAYQHGVFEGEAEPDREGPDARKG
ncbi:MAG: hypothetical protein AB7R55_23590 [Gemmatimonadales bacterium]